MSAPSLMWISTIPIRAQENQIKAVFAHSACKYLYFVSTTVPLMLQYIIRKAGITTRHSFFMGSVSTLCAHISRYVFPFCVLPCLYCIAQPWWPLQGLQGTLRETGNPFPSASHSQISAKPTVRPFPYCLYIYSNWSLIFFSERQGTLNGVITKQPRPPTLLKQDCLTL